MKRGIATFGFIITDMLSWRNAADFTVKGIVERTNGIDKSKTGMKKFWCE